MIPVEEMAGRIRAACDARTDPNFLIIRRTDCRTILGFEEAVRRSRIIAEAGADIVYGEGLGPRMNSANTGASFLDSK